VWEGDRPADDESGKKFYLERIVPELDESSPWSTSPLMDEAIGSVIYFPMVWSMAEEASAFAAELAQQHGLVCYGPQRSPA
jgi:hypothetical protein